MGTTKIYQLKITLLDVKPAIWRRVLVESDTQLPNLHKIVQSSMGWFNSHMHQFIAEDIFYGPEDPYDDMSTVDYKGLRIDQFLSAEKDRIQYEYDFGDGWSHDIVLEKILPRSEETHYPVCVDGKNACPPEDCGGPWGYSDLLVVMKNPKHPEYEDMKEWLGGDLKPTAFDTAEVNSKLQMPNYGVFTAFH